jgi:hypothetical protein
LKKILKYFLKGIVLLAGLLLVLYIALFIYVSIHKKTIIKQVTDEIGKKIDGRVSIGDVELSFFSTFPNASVLLKKVTITDSLFAIHHHTFFRGEEIFATLSIGQILKKKFPVNGLKILNAAVYLYTDSTGYTNKYLFKSKRDSTSGDKQSSESNELRSIVLKSVNVVIDDRDKGKLHDISVNNLRLKLNQENESLLIDTKADLQIHNLAFNTERGSFLKEKSLEGNFDLRFNKKSGQLQFENIDIKISKQPFILSGKFDLTGNDPQFTLNIGARKVLYDFAKKLLPPKVDSSLSIVDLDKKFDAEALISGPLKGGQPLILISWKVENSNLITPFLTFDDATFGGHFTNEADKGLPHTDANSQIALDHFSAKWNGLPVTSNNIDILNLTQPLLTCDLQSSFSLSDLNGILGSDAIELRSGTGTIDLTYKGPFKRNTQSNSFVNGDVSFHDGTVLYTPRNVEMKNVNGKLILKNSDVLVESLQCVVFNNKIVMNGTAKNLLTLMNSQPNKASINWNIYSPSLNLGSFIYLLKSPKKVSSNSQKAKLGKISGKIDEVLDQGIINVVLKADKLQYKKFNASNAVADITLLQDRYVINKLSMTQGDGSMNMSGSLVNRKSDFHEGTVTATLNNVDVSKLFSAFNNFGQNGIEAQNISGKLSANINATLGLNDDGKAYPGSVAGLVDFSLKNGSLINFEPIKKLQDVIFTRRDFANIQFAELKDRLEIRNEEIKINRMEIESSVLSLFVEGVYSLKGNTDISIQVPLSNLKKRDSAYKPENLGLDKNSGASVFIRARPGSDGTIQFKADLFNKFGKEERKERRQTRRKERKS